MNSRADSSLRILQIGAVALLCLHWTAMSIPERLWGVHHLAFLPVPVSLALTALLAFAVALSLHVEACKWVGDRLDVAQRTLCDRSPAGGSHGHPLRPASIGQTGCWETAASSPAGFRLERHDERIPSSCRS